MDMNEMIMVHEVQILHDFLNARHHAIKSHYVRNMQQMEVAGARMA